jgi:hypothetical protein
MEILIPLRNFKFGFRHPTNILPPQFKMQSRKRNTLGLRCGTQNRGVSIVIEEEVCLALALAAS